MNKIKRWCIAATLAATALLAGCASKVWTTVTTYSAEGGLPAGAVLRIVPLKVDQGEQRSETGFEEQQAFDPLEFKYFADILGQRFSNAGYSLAKDDVTDLEVSLAYDVERRERDDDRPFTLYGSYGYFYRYGSVILVDDFDRERYEFVRRVKVQVARVGADESEPLLSLTAVSVGHCGHLSAVYDEMLEAIFTNLNRANGSIIRLPAKSVGRCEGSL